MATDKGTIKLAIKTLLEIVQSGQRNIEVTVLQWRGVDMLFGKPQLRTGQYQQKVSGGYRV